MRDILRKAKPQRLDDLIALNALYRPGPLRSGMVDDFIAGKQGKTEVKYELPELEPILADTYGVIAYQEQVMRISNVLAGSRSARPICCARRWGRRIPR
jgi:DNA polymerase-3 subunit alpha